MVDVLTPEQRVLNMSRIRGRDTKPEVLVRRGLHARGLRFRLHRKDLPGCPDLVFPRYRAVVLVHGCFWHGHQCHLFTLPETRTAFWSNKITSNVARDHRTQAALQQMGWRVLTIWECALRGTQRLDIEKVLETTTEFLVGQESLKNIKGSRAAKQLSRSKCGRGSDRSVSASLLKHG